MVPHATSDRHLYLIILRPLLLSWCETQHAVFLQWAQKMLIMSFHLSRDVVVEYSNNMKELAQKLLHMISESLGLPPSYVEETVGEVYQNITISYYSPCPQPNLALGLQAHSDIGAITLLIQDDVGGLEVLKDGEWIPVQPLPNAIIVILADQTEVSILISLIIFDWMSFSSNGLEK